MRTTCIWPASSRTTGAIHPRLSLNLGVRYELDTDVNNISRVDELNPIVAPFVTGERQRDTNNWAPRIGLQLVDA